MKYLVMLLPLLFLGCNCDSNQQLVEQPQSLFQCGEMFPLIDRREVTATICVDKNTGVRYLYVWGGMANGGPAITRYYDE